MNSVEKNKFLGMLYDILIDEGIIKYEEKPKDLKEKNERLEKYLRKLKGYQDRDYKDGTEERINRIKYLYYDRYIIKKENIPDKYFKNIEEECLNQGGGHINLINPQDEKEKNIRKRSIESVIRAQEDSLDNWLNYFLNSDSSYIEMWAKVWAFHGMLHIGILNTSKDGYERRSKTNTNPFVPLDVEILDRCIELVEKSFKKNELMDEEIKKLVSSGSFPKLYGTLLANKRKTKAETTENTEGIWIKYNKESEKSIIDKLKSGQEPEHIKLYNSLQRYNTGWCTGDSRYTAKEQILQGDFYVYYSKDLEGGFTVPRLAIRMRGESIGEIRGIAENQNIESNMKEILEEKLKEIPDRDEYKRRESDMKILTIIYNKYLNGEELSKEELIFLYEIDSLIIRVGYFEDPRIKEIISSRNKRKDIMYVLGCNEEQIGSTKEDFLNHKNLKYFEGDLDLKELTSADGLVLPEIIDGYLNLNGLTSAKGLVLPRKVDSLLLGRLTSVEGLDLTQTTVCRFLDLRGLTSAEGLDLSKINLCGMLNLNGLTSLIGIKLPSCSGGLGAIHIYNKVCKLEEVKEMQRQEEEALKNNKPKGLSRVKQEGFISNTIIILNIILFGVLCFILTLLIIR